MNLSPHEREALARIENDLATSDPTLSARLSRTRPEVLGPAVSPTRVGVLVLVLLTIIVVATMLPASWWAALAVVTTLLVVPWILLCLTERASGR